MTRLAYVMSTSLVVLAIAGRSSVSIMPKLIWNASASAPIGLYTVRTAADLGVADLVAVVQADGFAHERIAAAAPFDFVFANILAGPLVDLAPEMAAAIADRGRAMLAGFLKGQEDEVRAAYEAAGFRRINRLDHDSWPVLLFAKV